MKVLVLHSDVPPGAPVEDQDTLVAADAVARALRARGHEVVEAPFFASRLRAVVEAKKPDVVFNLVEGIDGKGRLAHMAPRLLSQIGVPFTGAGPDALVVTADKPRTKRILRAADLPTPDWSEPPVWDDLYDGRWSVRSAHGESAPGLTGADGVVEAKGVYALALERSETLGGVWFAERYVGGREFNIAIQEKAGVPLVLPMAELTSAAWSAACPRTVGSDVGWGPAAVDAHHAVRAFGLEQTEPGLARELRYLCEEVWDLFQCRGAAQIDFRVDSDGHPQILDIHPAPAIAPGAGLVAAAQEVGLTYPDLIESLVMEAMR